MAGARLQVGDVITSYKAVCLHPMISPHRTPENAEDIWWVGRGALVWRLERHTSTGPKGFNICPSGWAGFDSAKPAIAASPCLLWMGARYTSTGFLLGFPCIWFGLFLPLVVSEKRSLRHTMTQPSSRFLRVHYLSSSYALPSTNDLPRNGLPQETPPRSTAGIAHLGSSGRFL